MRYIRIQISYSPDKDGVSPGDTGSDIERILAFHELGAKDPIQYAGGWEAAVKNAIKNFEEDYQKSSK